MSSSAPAKRWSTSSWRKNKNFEWICRTLVALLSLEITGSNLSRHELNKMAPLGPLVWVLIFTQRHLVDFFGTLSGKTKKSFIFKIKFVSCFIKIVNINCFIKISVFAPWMCLVNTEHFWSRVSWYFSEMKFGQNIAKRLHMVNYSISDDTWSKY
jgi:hypothetical protein